MHVDVQSVYRASFRRLAASRGQACRARALSFQAVWFSTTREPWRGHSAVHHVDASVRSFSTARDDLSGQPRRMNEILRGNCLRLTVGTILRMRIPGPRRSLFREHTCTLPQLYTRAHEAQQSSCSRAMWPKLGARTRLHHRRVARRDTDPECDMSRVFKRRAGPMHPNLRRLFETSSLLYHVCARKGRSVQSHTSPGTAFSQ